MAAAIVINGDTISLPAQIWGAEKANPRPPGKG